MISTPQKTGGNDPICRYFSTRWCNQQLVSQSLVARNRCNLNVGPPGFLRQSWVPNKFFSPEIFALVELLTLTVRISSFLFCCRVVAIFRTARIRASMWGSVREATKIPTFPILALNQWKLIPPNVSSFKSFCVFFLVQVQKVVKDA